jgi:hypothetical protein
VGTTSYISYGNIKRKYQFVGEIIMIRYITFNRVYKSDYANYKFFPNVKYALKNENSKYYFTIKDVRLSKKLEFDLYESHNVL